MVVSSSKKPSKSILPADVFGNSPVLLAAFAAARRVSDKHCSVLIRGETGTGKERLARLIHEESGRKGSFLSINCATLVETLIESELFGHEKGAFTGASTAKAGLFEAANGGTLFLDEVGELPASQQSRLLRVLAEGAIRRVGGQADIRVNVRVIAATHRNLGEESGFRRDLYFRLAEYVIHLPPLRDRGGDVLLIAKALLKDVKVGGQCLGFCRDAERALLAHDWPGNVRELKNVMNQVVIDARHPRITARQILATFGASPGALPISSGDLDLAIRDYIADRGQVETADVRSTFRLSKSAAQRRLQRLCENGVLALSGKGHSCLYSAPPPVREEPSSVDRERQVVEALTSGPRSRREVCDIADLSDRTANRVLTDLVKAGRVSAERHGRTTLYSLLPKRAS